MNDSNDQDRDAARGGDRQLDRLLSDWHADNVEAARAGRDRLLDRLESEREGVAGRIDAGVSSGPRSARANRRRASATTASSFMPGRGVLAAALFVIVAMLAVLALPDPQRNLYAGVVQVPDGGRLDAFDGRGELIGPCPLQHTDVEAEISGPIVSVSIRQRYANPYDTPIEAVYTFPMSNRAAVHSMTMTVVDPDGGERIVEGEVKERALARAIYEQARDAGFVTSLLEQERPNIFTQSVANIEPGATVTVEIGYLEVVDARNGEYAFEFPTVVGPRYIPGGPRGSSAAVPDGMMPRRGIVLRGPGRIVPFATAEDWNDYLQRPVEGFDVPTFAAWMDGRLDANPDAADRLMRDLWTPNRVFQVLASGVRIDRPTFAATGEPAVVVSGSVEYDAPVEGGNGVGDVVPEFFALLEGGYGRIGDRWFHWQPPISKEAGAGFAADTDQVPDASRITPMPVRPDVRAGHDISITVSIDTGGVPIESIEAPLHEVVESRVGDDRIRVALADRETIPNRDFVLRWRLADDAISESIFTHVAVGDGSELLIPGPPTDEGMKAGGYLTMVLAPPARVAAEDVRPRELVFVLDTSGSMRGFPIEKSKAVVRKAIDSMRPNDTFNVITFAGRTKVLWEAPRSATEENRLAAQRFVDGVEGGGGTEMMEAIRRALVQDGATLPGPIELANTPADGRMVAIAAPYSALEVDGNGRWLAVREGLRIPMSLPVVLPTVKDADPLVELNGRWSIVDGLRRYEVAEASFVEETVAPPMRIVVFLTDGYVGNDQGIVQAVRENARTTRVFSLGVGNSPNRFLLDSMAREGRGAVDYVLLADGADAVVDRLVERLETPVLTDIEVRVEGVAAFDLLPRNPAGLLPDLFDASPILLHARYDVPPTAVDGAVIVSGNTGAGRYERRIPIRFEPEAPDHASIATLWGRAKVEDVLAPHLLAVEQGTTPPAVEAEVVGLGRRYSLVTPFTSFVAVEKSRIVVGGRPRMVTIPIELPEGTNWEGFFGTDCPPGVRERALELAGVSEDERVLEEVGGIESEDLGLAGSREAAAEGRWFAEPDRGGRPMTAGRAVSRLDQVRVPAPIGKRSVGRGSRSAPGGGGGGFGGGGRGGRGSGGAHTLGSNVAVGRGAVSTRVSESTPPPMPEPAAVASPAMDADDRSGADVVADESSNTLPEPAVVEATESAEPPRVDLDRLVRVLDRPLLFLGLGAPIGEIEGVPSRGLDGRPWFWKGTVEVTILFSKDAAAPLASLRRIGVVVEGRSTVGDSMVVVGRVRVDDLLALGQVEAVSRVVPTS